MHSKTSYYLDLYYINHISILTFPSEIKTQENIYFFLSVPFILCSFFSFRTLRGSFKEAAIIDADEEQEWLSASSNSRTASVETLILQNRLWTQGISFIVIEPQSQHSALSG